MERPKTFLPYIETPEDYDAFRRLLNSDLFGSFYTWSERQHQEAIDLARGGGGNLRVIRVKVDPERFAEDCYAAGRPITMDALLAFATEKGSRWRRD